MKLLVLDKDGTLTRTKSGHTFVQHPEDQVLIDGVAEAIAAYTADGWTMAIASNQGGVATGHKTLEQAIAEMRYCIKLILSNVKWSDQIPELEASFCPDDGKSCYTITLTETRVTDEGGYSGKYRKPNEGMLARRVHWANQYSRKLMVGDHDEDFGAATRAGFEFMHVSDWLEPFN